MVTISERLGRPECPYLTRWVLNLWLISFRLHHWTGSDDPRHRHDHPWWYISFVFLGGYTDRGEDGDVVVRAPTLICRPAEHRHTVQVHHGGCWSFLITGREFREWGFWVGKKFLKRNKYFYAHGVHQCDKWGSL